MSTGKHYTHGNTPAAWTACTIIMVAFLLGTIGVVIANWPLFWVGGVGLAIAGLVVGRVMVMMGYGQGPVVEPEAPDTVTSSASSQSATS